MSDRKMADPSWIVEARKHIGLREKNNISPVIRQWCVELNVAWLGNVPWCGIFMAKCAKESGLSYPKNFYRAKDWATHGVKLGKPAYGCVVVFNDGGQHHVGFVVGRTADGCIMVLGGNQGDMVKIAKFKTSRVIAYRWLSIAPYPERYNLPMYAQGQLAESVL